MSKHQWRISDDRLEKIPEATADSRAKTAAAFRSMAGVRGGAEITQAIADLVGIIDELGRDTQDARRYLAEAETEQDRLRVRVRELEGMIGVRVINNQAPAPPSRPWPNGRPDEIMCAAGTDGDSAIPPGSLS